MSATNVLDDRKYTKEHEWAKKDGAEYVIGITAFAVDQLGDITLVSIDVAEGARVEANKPFGTVESVKTLSDLYCPVSGTVRRVNAALADRPELINEDCWEQGWMVAIEPDPGADEGALLEPGAYRELLAQAD
ncbi:MAG TPA: glycine cleavage system protein GcvH [Polyangiaceae bacterium]|nr:glycine cleavage system protein GcvH [Polyangiaceae bacterium]